MHDDRRNPTITLIGRHSPFVPHPATKLLCRNCHGSGWQKPSCLYSKFLYRIRASIDILRGGRIFKQTAPVIKLPSAMGQDDHLRLLGLLNSSTACFWMKQVFHSKGGGGIGGGLASEGWEQFHAFDATKLGQFPVPDVSPLDDLAHELGGFARKLNGTLPAALVAGGAPSSASLDVARERAYEIRHQMIALQKELDWRCYQLYGVTDDDDLYLPPADVPPSASASAPSRSSLPGRWPRAMSRPGGSSGTAPRQSPRSLPAGPPRTGRWSRGVSRPSQRTPKSR